MPVPHYDVIIVGSGFGGSVSALRLTEKGYRVAVMESGRRFGPDDFPKTSWRLRRFLWAPKLGLRGRLRSPAPQPFPGPGVDAAELGIAVLSSDVAGRIR